MVKTYEITNHESGGGVDTASAKEVAQALGTTEAGLAQMRYRGTGPKFCRVGKRRVIYRWRDVAEYLEANTERGGGLPAQRD